MTVHDRLIFEEFIMTKTNDFFTEITNNFITALEAGTKPWVRDWDNSVPLLIPSNINTGNSYSGINVLSLWYAQDKLGFTGHTYCTFNQVQEVLARNAKEEGKEIIKHEKGKRVYYTDVDGNSLGHIRKGATGLPVVRYVPKYIDSKGNKVSQNHPNAKEDGGFLKRFTVFNSDQIEGFDSKQTVWSDEKGIEAFFANVKKDIPIHHEGVKPHYNPSEDEIVVPHAELFKHRNNYYATLAHEILHATGHSSRLNRTFGKTKGDDDYCRDELVADIGAYVLISHFGINGSIENHASYVSGWLKQLKEDNKALQKAFSDAEEAVKYLLNKYHKLDS